MINANDEFKTKVTHRGKWIIDKEPNLYIDCYVTNNKRRLLSLRGAGRALELKGAGSTALSRNLKSNWINPYLSYDLQEWIEKVDNRQFERIEGMPGSRIIPLDGELFVDICKAYINAQKAGLFTDKNRRVLPKWSRQYYIADKLLKIMSAFAKVGIVALIDEITGYQEERERDDLQRLLSLYISDELMPWTRQFPMEFFKEMFRLWGWPFNPITYKKTGPRGPRYAGKLVRKFVYEKLPSPVLKELEKKNPPNSKWQRRNKLFQWLSEDIGNRHLEKQVAVITTLFKASSNKRIFLRNFARAFSEGPQQIEMGFMEEIEK